MKRVLRITLLLIVLASTTTSAQTSDDTAKTKSKDVDVASVASFLTSPFKKSDKDNSSKNPNPILAAIEDGDIPRLKEVIASGIDINATYDGETALTILCDMLLKKDIRDRKSKMIEVLLNVPGIKVNVYNKKFSHSPLQSISGVDNYDNIAKLIELGADVNRLSSIDDSPPIWRATVTGPSESGESKTMAILNHAGSELNVNFVGIYDLTSTRNAIKVEYTDAVELLLKRGAYIEDVMQATEKPGLIFETRPNKKHDILDILMKYGANKYGPSTKEVPPLNWGMYEPEYADWSDYFITTYDVDVNYVGSNVPAIVVASGLDNVKGLEVLFKHGAEVDLSIVSNGVNGLEMAAGSNSLNAAKYLIDKDANVNYFDHIGTNPLMMAAGGYHYNMIKLLVKEGADLNKTTNLTPWGSPLAFSAIKFNPSERKKNGKTMELLIELGADPDLLLASNSTALMQAAKLGTKVGYKGALVNSTVLIEAGANVNLQNNSGETALMIASGSGNKKLVELLIESKADLNIKSSLNETALNYADNAQFYKNDIIKLLEEAGATKGANNAASSSSNSDSSSNSVSKSVSSAASGDIFGTWHGYNSDQKMVEMTFIANKNNTYSFSSSYKVNGAKKTIAKHNGKISISGTSYKLTPSDGQKPNIYSYEIVNGKLIIDGGRPLDKIK